MALNAADTLAQLIELLPLPRPTKEYKSPDFALKFSPVSSTEPNVTAVVMALCRNTDEVVGAGAIAKFW